MRKGRFADTIQRADLFSPLLIIEVQSMIKLEHIEVTFGSFKALKDINIDIHEGEFFTFLGPSGCGKTTTLRTITGFISPSAGTVSVRGKDITLSLIHI